MKTKIILLILFMYSFVYAQQYGSWHEIDSLDVFKVGFGMALLPNGNLLVGGNDLNFGQTSCEIYDFTNAQWRFTDSLNVPRISPKMIILKTGKVLVASTYENRSCELFDPATETWTMTDSIPSSHDWGQTVTKLIDGRVLVAGGNHLDTTITPWELTLVNECDIFNPSTERWTIAAPMLIQRDAHTATLLSDGRVLVTGGSNTNSLGLRECEIYDPIANSWEIVAPMNDIRYTHSAILLPNGKVFVSGGAGKSTEVYDVQNNTWTNAGDMINYRSGNAMYYLSDINKILIFGDENGLDSLTNTWEIFDVDNLESIYSKTFPAAQFLYEDNSLMLKNGNILLAGGEEWGITQSGMLWRGPTKRSLMFDVVTDVITNDEAINNYKLFQNYPNPFNPSTNISFQIPQSAEVNLTVYNSLGQKVKELINNNLSVGKYSVDFNAESISGNLPSGLYIYRLTTSGNLQNYTEVKKMLLLK